MTDPTLPAWSRENDLLFQVRRLREENERLREDHQGVDAVAALTEEGWTWDGDQWQRPALPAVINMENFVGSGKPVVFNDQPEQEPICPDCKAAVLYECVACSSNNYPPQKQAEPVAYYHPRNGFYWAKQTSIFAPTVVDVPPMPLYTSPPQRPWVGLTDDEIVHLKMLGRDLEFVSMTALRRFARDIEKLLKDRNV